MSEPSYHGSYINNKKLNMHALVAQSYKYLSEMRIFVQLSQFSLHKLLRRMKSALVLSLSQ